MDDEVSRLRKKVENYPSPSAYNRLAELLRISGDHAGALDACQRCIREFPRNGQAYVIIATIELGQSNRAEAISQLQLAVEKDSRCYAAFRMLADLQAEDGQLDESIGLLHRILAFKPDDQGVAKQIEELTAKRAQAPSKPTTRRIKAEDDGSYTKRETETIDLSSMGSLSSSGIMNSPAASPTKAPIPGTSSKSARSGNPLAALCAEPGVRGALIADQQGRAIAETKLPDGQGDLLAALASSISASAAAALETAGSGTIDGWSIHADNGQILTYQKNLSVVAVAEPNVKAALLELRSRQALIDMGEA